MSSDESQSTIQYAMLRIK